jgi:hypothetical protein
MLRQPLWKRALLALYMPGRMPTIRISDRFLKVSADNPAEQINDYSEAHAPAGWEWPAVRRFMDDDDNAPEDDDAPGAEVRWVGTTPSWMAGRSPRAAAGHQCHRFHCRYR